LRKNQLNNSIDELFYDLSLPLQKFIFNIVKNRHDAEDLVADTFVRIIEYIDSNSEFPSKALCYAIARNLSIDFLRRKKKVYVPSDEEFMLYIQDECDVESEVEEIIINEYIEELVSEMPEVYSNIFLLKFSDELSFLEIGSVMGIKENHARVMYYRAKNKLKKIIEERKRNE